MKKVQGLALEIWVQRNPARERAVSKASTYNHS
jgi:hypothetical protein